MDEHLNNEAMKCHQRELSAVQVAYR